MTADERDIVWLGAELAAARRALQPRRSPNLWWPDDRAWCVATEIDFGWTYVGGTYRAIARILASPDLERYRRGPTTARCMTATD